jgi:hypothetical protein
MASRGNVPQHITYRGFSSRFALPFQADLDSLGPGMMPFGFLPFSSVDMVSGGTVGVGATVYGSMTQEDDCWITHLVGSSINPASPGVTGNFTVQFYDSERKKLWTPQPILFGNALGSAKQSFFLRRLYLLPSQGELKCSVVNLATFAAEIQVVAWGLRKDIWKVVS